VSFWDGFDGSTMEGNMKGKRIWILVFLAAISITACQASDSPETMSPTNTPQTTPVPSPTPTNTPLPTATPIPAVERFSLNEEWDQYINRNLGFSMKIPKMMYRWDAVCEPKEQSEGTIYTPGPGMVPVVVIEGGDRVYITSETVIALSSSKADPDGKTKYPNDRCEIKKNTLEMLWHRDYTSYIWDIYVQPVDAEEDLERMVDNYYGECFSVGEITPVEGGDFSFVHVLGDQNPIEESQCLLRGMYIFAYSKDLDVAATWKTGQSVHFPKGPENRDYDGEMWRSFQFIPRLSDQ
jgi:hypothetical protein